MNLTAETGEINEITGEQNELQSSWEKVRATALRSLEFLEFKDETKSNLSYGSRKSGGSNKSSLSSRIALLDLKAKRAASEQKIIFSDTIKEQEKAFAKLKLQQELSETRRRSLSSSFKDVRNAKKIGAHRLRFRDIVREKFPDFEKLGLRNSK